VVEKKLALRVLSEKILPLMMRAIIVFVKFNGTIINFILRSGLGDHCLREIYLTHGYLIWYSNLRLRVTVTP
jgi:hypothetical protein